MVADPPRLNNLNSNASFFPLHFNSAQDPKKPEGSLPVLSEMLLTLASPVIATLSQLLFLMFSSAFYQVINSPSGILRLADQKSTCDSYQDHNNE